LFLALKKLKIFPAISDFTIEGNSTKRQDFFLESFSSEDELINLSLEYKFIFLRISSYFFIFLRISSYFFIFLHISSYFFIFLHISSYFFIFLHISSYFFIFLRNEAYSHHKVVQKIHFPLPITVNKFMEFKPIDSTVFKSKWRSFYENITMSEPLPFDRHILQIPLDLQRYFPFIIDLNSSSLKKNVKKEKKSLKFGGFFTINGEKDFLLKIRLIEDQFICFELTDNEEKGDFSHKILDTLCYIFCRNS